MPVAAFKCVCVCGGGGWHLKVVYGWGFECLCIPVPLGNLCLAKDLVAVNGCVVSFSGGCWFTYRFSNGTVLLGNHSVCEKSDCGSMSVSWCFVCVQLLFFFL